MTLLNNLPVCIECGVPEGMSHMLKCRSPKPTVTDTPELRCAECDHVPQQYCHYKEDDRPSHARVDCDFGYHPFRAEQPPAAGEPVDFEALDAERYATALGDLGVAQLDLARLREAWTAIPGIEPHDVPNMVRCSECKAATTWWPDVMHADTCGLAAALEGRDG